MQKIKDNISDASVGLSEIGLILTSLQLETIESHVSPILHLFILSYLYLFFYVGYTISISFIEFLRKFCVAI